MAYQSTAGYHEGQLLKDGGVYKPPSAPTTPSMRRQHPVTAELNDNGNRIVLHNTMWSEKPLVAQIPGKRWDADLKAWTLPLSWAACVHSRAVFGTFEPETNKGLAVGNRLAEWARERRFQRSAAMTLRDALELVEPSPHQNEHDNIMYPFQIPGRDFLVTARHALLGDEMGAGKTLQTLAALRVVDKKDEKIIYGTGELAGTGCVDSGAYPALVVCPNSVKRNWAREIIKWLPEARPIVIHGSAAKRRKQLEEARHDGHAVIIMNIESLRLHSRLAPYGSVRLKRCIECDPKHGDAELKPARCEVHDKELQGFDFKVCVLDEAHRVKDPRALQTRAIWQVFHAASVEYRWALTGTPVANSPADIWSILHTIAHEEYPAKTAFLERYALKEENYFGGVSWVGLKPETKDEFYSLIDPHFRRMQKAIVLDQLPDKIRTVRHVDMSPKQAKAYGSIEAEYTMTDENGVKLVAGGNLAAATRLLQLASAMCEIDVNDAPDDPAQWKVTLADPSPKVDELMAIIDDNPGRPLAIAAEHRQLIDLAANRLTAAGIEFGRITGGVSADERDATIEAFQSGKLDYVLFTFKAGGVGINLTRADTLVRLQRSWSLVDSLQSEDRVHRIGSEQHEAITIIDIITADTVEEGQVERLYAKMSRLEEITRDRAQLRKLGKDTSVLDAELARLESDDLLIGGIV